MTERRLLFFFSTATPYGGVETWLRSITPALRSRGFVPLVGVPNDSGKQLPRLLSHHCPEWEVVSVSGDGLSAQGRVCEVVQLAKRIRPEAFIPLIGADGHAAACIASAEHKIKYILSLRGVTPAQLADAFSYIPHVHAAIVPSLLTREFLCEIGVERDRCLHVPNGSDLAQFPRAIDSRAPRIEIVMVCRLTSVDKRADDVIGFVEGLRARGVRFRLRIAGDGPLRSKINSSIMGEDVELLGNVERSYLQEHLYPSAHVQVQFSDSEPFCIALLEGMQHGVVPVVSDFVGRRREGFVRVDQTGLVFPIGDTSEAAALVERLFMDRSALARLSEAAKDLAVGDYSWPMLSERWADGFEQVIAMSARTDPLKIGRVRTGLRAPTSLWLRERLVRFLRRKLGMKVVRSQWPWVEARQDDPHGLELFELVKRLDRAIPFG